MGVRCGWGLVAASPLWVFRGPDLPAHELPIRFMGARREKIRGCLCRKDGLNFHRSGVVNHGKHGRHGKEVE